MAETQVSGFDRFNDALRSLDDQLQDLRERFDERRKELTDDIRKRRDDAQTRLRKTEIFKRAEQARRGIEDRADRTLSQILDAFGLASKSEVEKLSRKLNTISKKLNELVKEH